MRIASSLWIIAVVMFLIDIYVFVVMKTMMQSSGDRVRNGANIGYWLISIVAIIALVSYPRWHVLPAFKHAREYIFVIVLGLLFAKVLASLFFLVDDLRRAAMWLMSKAFHKTGADFVQEDSVIKRSVFLSWLGIATGSALFGSLMYGFSNKYNYKIKNIKLTFKNLPASFRGFKIVQISDIHSGSFNNKPAVNHGVDLVLQQNADLILFTGDLVNDKAIEMIDYMDVFNRLKAPHGVFSTLGNHDYGDYAWGVNPQGQEAIDKANNLIRLKEVHKELGWRLLMNEHVPITKNGESFALIGIENWGAKAGFPKYGKMSEAYPGAEKYPFKILMSHDPSHWDAEVRPKYSDIDLTLSGHTHGMQFGVETPWFKWSPVQWVYRQWAGLYKTGNQHLYVNRGYGFIGYPGRVGILPEITVIELG